MLKLHRLLSVAATVAITFGVSACTSTTVDDPTTEGGLETSHPDLFACGVPLSCPAICTHLGPGDCSLAPAEELMDCEAEWIAGDDGALLYEDRPGPGTMQGDELWIYLDDGTIVRQERSRSCDQGWCDLSAVPWVIGDQKICTKPGDNLWPEDEDCRPAQPPLTCDDLR